mmetsp:Transcript_29749/g.64091  ORF Transcript_29749/g.64091 Transcript_29749/m.64091 type:complete len:214 (-) Transcript_29749:374-1015(-)
MGDGGEVGHEAESTEGLSQRRPPRLWMRRRGVVTVVILGRGGSGNERIFNPLGIPHDRIRPEFSEVLCRLSNRPLYSHRIILIIVVRKEHIREQLFQPTFPDRGTPSGTTLIHQHDPFERLPIQIGNIAEQCRRRPARFGRRERQPGHGSGTSKSWSSLQVEDHARCVYHLGGIVIRVRTSSSSALQIQFGTFTRRKCQIGEGRCELLIGGIR